MRVAVVGAGVVGVTTAYELASDGHEVTVLERRGGVAAEASFANAGIVAPGYVTPWAAPGMPGLAQLWKTSSTRFAASSWPTRPIGALTRKRSSLSAGNRFWFRDSRLESHAGCLALIMARNISGRPARTSAWLLMLPPVSR